MSEDRGFLSRWSRRKRAAGGAAARVPPPAAPGVVPGAAPPEGAAAADAGPPVFDPASLPPVEDLTAESDFAAFLREEVPAALRRAALRRAWTLDPAIRDFIGPADYAWDFNAPGSMPGFSFELAGDLDRLLAQAIGASAEEAPEEERPVEAPVPEDAPASPETPVAAEAAPPRLEDAPAVAAEASAPAPAEAPDAAPVAAPRRRHGGALPS